MSNRHPFRAIPWLAVFFVAFVSSAMGKSPAAGKNKPMIRIVCVSGLAENQEVIVATRDAKEKWQELGTVELRASMISDWLRAKAGELHLAVREEGALKSICQFTFPADARRSLVLLIADQEKKTYDAHFVDPEKAKFVKGTFLVSNLTTQTASVSFGQDEKKIEPGEHLVVKPTLEGNGMFRMQVSHPGKNGEPEACYDRYTSGDEDSRELIFLLPDKEVGLRVLSLPLFSEVE